MGFFKDARKGMSDAKKMGDYHGGMPSMRGAFKDISAMADAGGDTAAVQQGMSNTYSGAADAAMRQAMANQQAGAAAGAAPAAKEDPADRLKKLGELKDSGVISDEEFETKKAEILKEL